MKPVAIFRHLPIEGPGYFATFLDNNHIPWRLIKVDAGESLPKDLREFSGLVFMGGPMSAIAKAWFGDLTNFESFHWHGETYSLPQGATCILSSPYCENQAFAMNMHLGMQCHVEMTERMVRDWCSVAAEELLELLDSDQPAVQSINEIEKNLSQRVETLNKVAETLYLKWISYLK